MVRCILEVGVTACPRAAWGRFLPVKGGQSQHADIARCPPFCTSHLFHPLGMPDLDPVLEPESGDGS